MSLGINDEAPNFTAETWTELGYMAGLQSEFAKRNCKILGLSVDPVASHAKWAVDIEETQGHKVNYPMIVDPELKVATPVNWKQGDDVIILTSVPDEEAKQKFPGGWKAPRPYLRIASQPK